MLLQEYRPFKVDKQLVEQSIKENKSLIVSVFYKEQKLKTKMVEFIQEILEREVEEYMKAL